MATCNNCLHVECCELRAFDNSSVLDHSFAAECELFKDCTKLVEQKHGRWTDNQYVWECDQCHTWLEVTQGTADMNYCPNCGADMRGKEDGK